MYEHSLANYVMPPFLGSKEASENTFPNEGRNCLMLTLILLFLLYEKDIIYAGTAEVGY